MKNQKGVSLIELSLSMAVIMLITSVVAGAYAVNRANARFDTARSDLMAVTTAVEQMATNGNLQGITTNAIASSRLVPQAMIVPNGANFTLLHNLGGTFEVSSQAMPAVATATGIRIRMTGLDRSRCLDAAVSFAERFDAVVAGGTTVKNRIAAVEVPVDRGAAETGCAANSGQLDFFLLP